MQKNYYEVFNACLSGREAFIQVTLIDVFGSVPQKPGAKILVNKKGLLTGTVGGGAIEQKAIEYSQKMLLEKTASAFLDWNLKTELGMDCGGRAQLFFEAFNQYTWPIVVFGAGHVAQNLVPILLSMPCEVTCVDDRQEWLDHFDDFQNLVKINRTPMKDYVKEIPNEAFVVIMTREHKYDYQVLEEALKKDFRYLGVMGSKNKAKALREKLLSNGISDAKVKSFFSPVGLPIGTNHLAEISISIAAQLLKERDRENTEKF